MAMYRKTILWLSSVLLLATSCSREPYRELALANERRMCIDSLQPQFTTIRYRTFANVTGHDLNGILVLKKTTESHTRAVFAGDAGITFFDLELYPGGFTVHYMMKKLNYKAVAKLLASDIGLILMHGVDSNNMKVKNNSETMIFIAGSSREYTTYHTDKSCTSVTQAEKWGRQSLKTEALLFGRNQTMPDSVSIRHTTFDFTIQMKQMTH